MLFNSATFLAFFACFFPLFWIVHRRTRVRNALILIGSYVFYGSWDWRFLSLIIISTLVDYHCGKRIAAHQDVNIRRRYLTVSILVNLGILFVFKYNDFFIQSFADLLSVFGIQANFWSLRLILPVGISFYTFQTLSYTIDIYGGRFKPTRSLLNFATFVAFFPQLVAGPIERARNLLPQIEGKIQFNFPQLREGLFLILWGLAKKTLIADRVAVYVDAVFADPGSFTGEQCLVAVLFFAIQIYCDFSGYSDIARGLAKTIGIELMVNFDTPYFAASIREFWQRWHVSLSTWFRDYLYIPLGGSRTTTLKLKRNLLITFVISGLWHGAAYTFLIWGLIHALGYLLDPHSRLSKSSAGAPNSWQKLSGIATTLIVVCFAWVFFRAATLPDAMIMLQNILALLPGVGVAQAPLHGGSLIVAMNQTEFILSIYFIAVLLISDVFMKDRGIEGVVANMSSPARWIYSWFLLTNLLLLAPSDTGAFIYFQF